jgi:NhaP-type Na+/H+ or K+/H+ antiporter
VEAPPFFEFSPYHLLLTVMGMVIILAYWLPRFVSSREPAAAPLLIFFVLVYGVRGIGPIYYLCYAGAQIEFVNELQLWSLIGLTIMLSTMLHGFTVGWAMERLSEQSD